jgi:hypothetical protein
MLEMEFNRMPSLVGHRSRQRQINTVIRYSGSWILPLSRTPLISHAEIE